MKYRKDYWIYRLVIVTQLLAACAHPQTPTSSNTHEDWPYVPRVKPVEIPPHVYGEYTAELIGLPLLTDNALPSGYREYRFEVPCGMCLPSYLIRARVDPKRNIIGEAYLIWFGYDSARAGDTSDLARRGNNPPNNCESRLRNSSLRGPGGDYRWCKAQLSKNLSWKRLLKSLDALGILDLPTAEGYAPDPPALAIDTLRLKDRTLSVPKRDCQDIGSLSLNISMLIGAEYRSASFWCLESAAPGKPEHFRVAKARKILVNSVMAYQDTIR